LNIAIVGSGLIGQAWAIVFARAGLPVRLWDGDTQALANAKTIITQQLQALEAHKLVDNAAHAINCIQT
jgi:3-hydroxyacyl-CoA dehydrogenase